MTALELITRKKPFSSVVCDAVVVVEIYHNRKPVCTSEVNSKIWTFLLTCWSKIPSDRPRAIDASDFFLRRNNDVEEERRRMTRLRSGHSDGFMSFGSPPSQTRRAAIPLPRLLITPITLAVLVPEKQFAAFLGKKCYNFRQLEEAYGVTITYCLSADGRPPNEVVICSVGGFCDQSLQAAKAEIEKVCWCTSMTFNTVIMFYAVNRIIREVRTLVMKRNEPCRRYRLATPFTSISFRSS